jgi:hypothetical protein
LSPRRFSLFERKAARTQGAPHAVAISSEGEILSVMRIIA